MTSNAFDEKLEKIKKQEYGNGLIPNIITIPSDADKMHSEMEHILVDYFGAEERDDFEDIGFKHAKNEIINLRNAVSFQEDLQLDNFIQFLRIAQNGHMKDLATEKEPSYVIKYKNKNFIIDGNHRIAVLIFLEKTSTKVKLLDLDDIVKNGFRG
jgi:hypothetical protein